MHARAEAFRLHMQTPAEREAAMTPEAKLANKWARLLQREKTLEGKVTELVREQNFNFNRAENLIRSQVWADGERRELRDSLHEVQAAKSAVRGRESRAAVAETQLQLIEAANAEKEQAVAASWEAWEEKTQLLAAARSALEEAQRALEDGQSHAATARAELAVDVGACAEERASLVQEQALLLQEQGLLLQGQADFGAERLAGTAQQTAGE